jgi:uncharacterized membrane protein
VIIALGLFAVGLATEALVAVLAALAVGVLARVLAVAAVLGRFDRCALG